MSEEEGDDYGGGYYRQPTLGELSRSLATERGELAEFDLLGPTDVPPQSPGGPAAVADLNRDTELVDATENRYVSPRPPALLYQVVSTFDSRPIQGFDFQHTECGVIVWVAFGGGASFADVEFTYVVPENTVAILRSWRYQVVLAPVNMVTEGDCWLFSDLLVNDQPVREYNRMLHPIVMRKPFDSFLIVDERKKLTLRLRVADDGVDPVEFFADLVGLVTKVEVEMYGNLLLKTGIPIEFEIANAIGGGQL